MTSWLFFSFFFFTDHSRMESYYLRSRIETKSTARLFPTSDRTFVISRWRGDHFLIPYRSAKSLSLTVPRRLVGFFFSPSPSSSSSFPSSSPLSSPRNPENREKCFKFVAIWLIVLIRKFPSFFLPSIVLRSFGGMMKKSEGRREGVGYRSVDTPLIARD